MYRFGVSLPGRLISVDGIRVFCSRGGAGAPGRSPLLFLHGWFTSHWVFREVVPPLCAAGHDVIAIDLPGFGESDRPPPGSYRYDAVAFADTVVSVLDALGVDRAHVCGHSMGGAVAITMAARRPERVDRLILVDALAFPFRLPPEAHVVLAPVAGPWLFRAFLTRRMVRYFLRRDLFKDPSKVTEDWVDYLWERANRPGSIDAALAALRFCVHPSSVVQGARAVRSPVLIVWGEDDRLFPATFARRLAGEMTGSEVRIIPACGHEPPLERPDEFLRAVMPFLGLPGAVEWRATA